MSNPKEPEKPKPNPNIPKLPIDAFHQFLPGTDQTMHRKIDCLCTPKLHLMVRMGKPAFVIEHKAIPK